MTVPMFLKMFETVGYPILTAFAAGYALFWLIKWLTGTFKQELKEEHNDIVRSIDALRQELDEEIRDTRTNVQVELAQCMTILIRLVDRVRVLEVNFIEHDETVRAAYGLTRADRKKPRHEVVEELKEQIKDAGKVNGD